MESTGRLSAEGGKGSGMQGFWLGWVSDDIYHRDKGRATLWEDKLSIGHVKC